MPTCLRQAHGGFTHRSTARMVPHIFAFETEDTHITTLADEKKQARRAARARRAEAACAAGPGAADKAGRDLLTLIGDVKDKVLAAYSPIRDEIGTSGLMTRAHVQGARVVLPVVQGAGKPLIFREWTPETRLVDGAFGARVPPETAAGHIPDIIVLPLLAFDGKGCRLGYGGGFYDRTLAELHRNRIVLAIGLAYEGQLMPGLPTEDTDQPMDGISTEAEVRWYRARMEG